MDTAGRDRDRTLNAAVAISAIFLLSFAVFAAILTTSIENNNRQIDAEINALQSEVIQLSNSPEAGYSAEVAQLQAEIATLRAELSPGEGTTTVSTQFNTTGETTFVTAAPLFPVSECPSPQNNPVGAAPTYASWERKIVIASGLIWEFYSDGKNIDYRTSVSGLAWSNATVVLPDQTRSWWFSVYQNASAPSQIWFAFASSAGPTYYFEYGNGTLNSNGTVTWSPFETSPTMGSNANYPSVTFDSYGHEWVAVESYAGPGPSVGPREIEVYAQDPQWQLQFVPSGFYPWPEPILSPLSDGGMALSVLSQDGQLSVYTSSGVGENFSAATNASALYEDFSAVSIGNSVYYAGVTVDGAVQTLEFTLGSGFGAPTQVSTKGDYYCGATISTDGRTELAVGFSSITSVLMTTSADLGGTWTVPTMLSSGDTGIIGISLTSDYHIGSNVVMTWSEEYPQGNYTIGTSVAPF